MDYVVPSARVNQKITEQKNLFLDIPVDKKQRVRFLPSIITEGEFKGAIFTPVVNHFSVQKENGDGTAIACLRAHGTEETGKACWICELTEYIRANFPSDKVLTKGRDAMANKLRAAEQYYAQVLVAEKEEDNTYSYNGGVRLLRLPPSGSTAVSAVMTHQYDEGETPFGHPHEGHDLSISHVKGQPWYRAMPIAMPMDLDVIAPTWKTDMIQDVLSKINPVVVTREEQKEMVIRQWSGVFDFDELATKTGM